MILFMVNKAAEAEPYLIPRVFSEAVKLNEGNVRLISWNQIQYTLSDSTVLLIKNINDLKRAVYDAAKQDPLCADMNKQLLSQYGVNLFDAFENAEDEFNKVINDLFDVWPHPVIGNILLSVGVRPQGKVAQYIYNWDQFPETYMNKQTKNRISALCFNPESAGLKVLTTSNRDQVRVCKDMTELARAVIGELSTFPTKRLEKIYALELCGSAKLFEAQKSLIRRVANKDFRFTSIEIRRNPLSNVSLMDLFMSDYIANPIEATQYIGYYLPELNDIESREDQWAAFVRVINCAIEGDCGLTYKKPSEFISKIIDECLKEFMKYPPVVRCAMIINGIKKFEDNRYIKRYSMAAVSPEDLKGTSDFIIKCGIVDASGREFIPELSVEGAEKKKILLWNWMREEDHMATMTYRHYLMPLWAGPSGHTAGIIEFYTRHIESNGVLTSYGWVAIGAIVPATMFTFWRLYYDKRICAVHTLAETYEGAYSFQVEKTGQYLELSEPNKGFVNSEIIYDQQYINRIADNYGDAFDTILFYPNPEYPIRNIYGIVNSVRIMTQTKKKYFVGSGYKSMEQLKINIDNLRNALVTKQYTIPQWSKPLVPGSGYSYAVTKTGIDINFTYLRIRNARVLNVRSFGSNQIRSTNNHSKPSERLLALYRKISGKKQYTFKEDFNQLPKCITNGELKPFLSAILFENISDCSLEGSAFSFLGTGKTDADFWKRIREYAPIKAAEQFRCIITDDRAFHFIGEIELHSSYRITDTFSLNLKSVLIESGLTEKEAFPQVSILSELSNSTDALELTMTLPLSGNTTFLKGEFADGKILTIKKMLSLFGIDQVISAASLLPENESIFGSLGLRSVLIELHDTELSRIEFTITAEKPWNLYDNKMTLQPYFEISIEYPFDSEKRKTDYTVLGRWTAKSTVFDLMYRSDKTITAKLAEGSALRLSDIADSFASGVEFPPIALTGMELDCDLVSKNFSLYLSADDVLHFTVGTAKIGIQNITFSLDCFDGKFADLSISGILCLGGMSLKLGGSYSADKSYSLQAIVYNELDYSLGDFAEAISKDLSGNFDKNSILSDFLTVNIKTFCVSYESKSNTFLACVDLDKVLRVSDQFSIDEIAFEISSVGNKPVEFSVIAQVSICSVEVSLLLIRKNSEFIIGGSVTLKDLTFASLAKEFGIDVESLPDFIREFTIHHLDLNFNITKKELNLTFATSAGTIAAGLGSDSGWSISYQTPPTTSINMLNMPLVGEVLQKLSPGKADFAVNSFELDASQVHGVSFQCLAFGEKCLIQIYKPNELTTKDLAADADSHSPTTVKWIKLNKTFAIITIQKIGLGLDGSKVVLLLDAALNVSPLSFSLMEAGVGINLSNPSDFQFYLSGFGVAFDNGTLSIGGSFLRTRHKEKDVYTGTLLIKIKTISAVAIGQYSDGSLMAYFALSAPLGGPPAFFVTGFALGFGYNKRLILPKIEEVPKYPLITAATKGFKPQILEELNEYIIDESNQNFVTAGVKFTSFKLLNGFLLVTVSFGKEFELGILGLADISMPPNVPVNPVAKAELALKACLNPSVGLFSAEARLTSESYILSKSCKLTGGFAAYFWFGNHEHSGDFVITLGGYHPAFTKPKHYPVVPRLGLNWNVAKGLNISGEMYFALTPSTIMAGGRLSAVYSSGNLKAWFIAYADFLISWKPFHYDIAIGVSIGASYRIDWWFIHKTFSIELAAKLHLWGPELQGTVRISWFIISFTISFSTGKDQSKKSLDWNEFKQSFLLNTDHEKKAQSGVGAKPDSDILTLSVDGIIGRTQKGVNIVSSDSLTITLVSKVPEKGRVRPVDSADLQSTIKLEVAKSGGNNVNEKFTQTSVTQNVPAAMWKAAPAGSVLKEESVVKDAVCGITYTLKAFQPVLFPKTQLISLEELYRNNTLKFNHCFAFLPDHRMDLSDEDSCIRFSKLAGSPEAGKRRQKFLADHGITEQVGIGILAEYAEDNFSEYILLKNSSK